MIESVKELGDLLLAVYHAGYCAGARLPREALDGVGLADLVQLIEARHRAEILAPRGWLDLPTTVDELPGWLLAHCERIHALGDSQPPAGFETAPLRRLP